MGLVDYSSDDGDSSDDGTGAAPPAAAVAVTSRGLGHGLNLPAPKKSAASGVGGGGGLSGLLGLPAPKASQGAPFLPCPPSLVFCLYLSTAHHCPRSLLPSWQQPDCARPWCDKRSVVKWRRLLRSSCALAVPLPVPLNPH